MYFPTLRSTSARNQLTTFLLSTCLPACLSVWRWRGRGMGAWLFHHVLCSISVRDRHVYQCLSVCFSANEGNIAVQYVSSRQIGCISTCLSACLQACLSLGVGRCVCVCVCVGGGGLAVLPCAVQYLGTGTEPRHRSVRLSTYLPVRLSTYLSTYPFAYVRGRGQGCTAHCRFVLCSTLVLDRHIPACLSFYLTSLSACMPVCLSLSQKGR